jgi:hypothetical protein
MRLVIEGLLFVAVLIGVSVGTAFATFRAGDVLKDFLFSLDGPAIVAQQAPYAADQAFTKDDLENKYHIFLLTQSQATGRLDTKGADHDWNQAELRKLDFNLANTPAAWYGTRNHMRLSFYIGSLTGIPGDVEGGVCIQKCGAFYDGGFRDGGGLIGLNQGYYDLNGAPFDQTIIDHELTHRLHSLIADQLDPGVKTILGDADLLENPALSDPGAADGCSAKALLALRSLADVKSDDPHVNFEEGVAETSEIYLEGHRAFLESFGPIMDIWICGGGDDEVSNEDAMFYFPQAQALYELWQNQVFAGYSYDEEGALVAPVAAPSVSGLESVTP